MDIKRILPGINKHIKADFEYVEPDNNAHLGLNVPEIVFQFGSIKSKIRSIPRLGRYMVKCILELRKTYHSLYHQPENPNGIISDKDLSDLESFVEELAIDDIGFTEVDTSYIFSNQKILYKNAIVILMKMDTEIIQTAPSKQAEKEIFRTYYELNHSVNEIKEFLNSRGYRAQAGPALGGEVNYPLLAQKAGMGAVGKHGLLITDREFGPSLRLAAVYTDIENLPFSDHNKHAWIDAFCDQCNRCVRECPVGAIYQQSEVMKDGSKQCIDYRKCAVPFSKNYGCTVCIKECVFFHKQYEKIKSGFLRQRL